MQITIDGKNFELNVEACKEAGFLKPVRREIKHIEFGDVFSRKRHGAVIVARAASVLTKDEKCYCLLGSFGMNAYSDVSGLKSSSEIIAWLNNNEYDFIGNINNEIDKMIENLREKVE